jgi:hypothetical protein
LTTIQYLSKVDITRLAPPWWRFWADLLLRLTKTFLASLAGAFAAAHPFDIVMFNWSAAINVAVLAVLAALAKGLLARVGDGTGPAGNTSAAGNPSTLPTSTYLAAGAGR